MFSPGRSAAARTLRAGLIASAGVLALTSCTSGAADAGKPAGGDWSPVTIEHAHGSTEITSEPERVVTIGWSDEGALLALGVVPVGMAESTWGGDDEGYLPWDLERIEELGAEKPAVFNTDDGVPVEEIAALDPDLILGVQSGLEENEYEQLSAVAPTIAYLDQPWMTDWKDATRTIGEALGRADEADEAVAGVEADIAEAAEEHPEFDGATAAVGALMPESSDYAFYTEGDPRADLMDQLGFTRAPFIDELENPGGTFYAPLSAEKAEQVETDMLVMWYDTPEAREDTEESALFSGIGAVEDGSYVAYEDATRAMAISSPNAISIPWVLDDFVGDLGEAME